MALTRREASGIPLSFRRLSLQKPGSQGQVSVGSAAAPFLNVHGVWQNRKGSEKSCNNKNLCGSA